MQCVLIGALPVGVGHADFSSRGGRCRFGSSCLIWQTLIDAPIPWSKTGVQLVASVDGGKPVLLVDDLLSQQPLHLNIGNITAKALLQTDWLQNPRHVCSMDASLAT